jgi:transposase
LADPYRFQTSRQVGAYLGLVPRQHSSGDSRPELGITKEGNIYMRQLLVNGAHYVLGPHGPDTQLRRWGLAKAEGGKNAKKRAIVAVARKLAVLLHRLWITGEVYTALSGKEVTAAA